MSFQAFSMSCRGVINRISAVNAAGDEYRATGTNRGGAPDGNTNAIRHGLTAGALVVPRHAVGGAIVADIVAVFVLTDIPFAVVVVVVLQSVGDTRAVITEVADAVVVTIELIGVCPHAVIAEVADAVAVTISLFGVESERTVIVTGIHVAIGAEGISNDITAVAVVAHTVVVFGFRPGFAPPGLRPGLPFTGFPLRMASSLACAASILSLRSAACRRSFAVRLVMAWTIRRF